MIKTLIQKKYSCMTNTVFGTKSLTAEIHDHHLSYGGFLNLSFTSQKSSLYAKKYGTSNTSNRVLVKFCYWR